MRIRAALVAVASTCSAFVPRGSRSAAPAGAKSSTRTEEGLIDDYAAWCDSAGVVGDKFALAPSAEDGRGLRATSRIEELEVIATVPSALALATDRSPEWTGRLVAEALRAREGDGPLAAYARAWRGGGWATESADLEDRDRDLDSLLATGSNNDFEIFKKFGLKCHPAIDRASYRLAIAAGCSKETAARAALVARGFEFRRVREALLPLCTGAAYGATTARRRRELEVADVFSKTLARAAIVDGDRVVVVPVHDALSPGAPANTKLVRDPRHDDDQADAPLLLVATRAIDAGEHLTRDFAAAPSVGQTSGLQDGADPDGEDERLRRLLHFGIRPTND